MNKTNSSLTKLLSLGGGLVVVFVSIASLIAFGMHSLAKGNTRAVPDSDTCRNLAAASLADINTSIISGDFTSLHSKLSPIWQAQITPEGLSQLLASFTERNLNFSDAVAIAPVLSRPPAFGNDGLLEVSGNFLTQPIRVEFNFAYARHNSDWKLMGFKLTRRLHEMPLPPENTIREITETVLGDFRTGVEKKNFSELHASFSSILREQVTIEQFERIFAGFLNESIDLSPVKGRPLTFKQPPALDEDGRLQVEGSYSSASHTVAFSLTFIPESGAWKILGFNINTN